MWSLRLAPTNAQFHFMRLRLLAFMLSGALVVVSIGSLLALSLNFGIDFIGGTLMEVRTEGPADIQAMRGLVGGLGLGDIALQEFGAPEDVLIRIQRQAGDESAQSAAIQAVKTALGDNVEYRRTEFVGPKVGAELREAGILAVVLALLAIMVYIWFRFEWQFSIGAVVALSHDVITTVGLFSVLQIEFNLSTVAAILTIAGYSINDTVVIYDRVRENLRRHKKTPISDLLDLSANQTLSRTLMTSLTTLLALLALYFFGGEVIRNFAGAMIWGVVIGTYSSVYLAVPLLLYMNIRHGVDDEATPAKTSDAHAADSSGK